MKKILSTLTAVAFVFIIASCTKNPSKVLTKKDGKWNVTYTATDAGTQVDSGTGHITFGKNDFTLSDDALAGFAVTGTWSYSKGSEELTLTVDGDATVFKVSDMKRKSETWTNTDGSTVTVYKLTKS